MDTLNEKKWFVYLGDHHEGPFSVLDLRGLMGQGRANSQSYVWCGGMPDWIPLHQVAELAANLAPSPAVPPPPPRVAESESQKPKTIASFRQKPDEADFDIQDTTVGNSIVAESPMQIAEPVAPSIALVPEAFEVTRTDTVASEAPAPEVAPMPDLAPLEEPSLEPSIHTDIPPVNSAPAPVAKIEMSAAVDSTSIKKPGWFGSLFKKKQKESNASEFAAYTGKTTAESYVYGSEHKPKRRFPVKLLTLLLIIGAVFAYQMGSFDPILNNKNVKPLIAKIEELSRPVMVVVREKAATIPYIKELFSPIRSVTDIDAADRLDLEKAIRTPIESSVAVAAALSSEDVAYPSFYVGTNLPVGAVFEIYVKGLENTLLNRFDYQQKTRATVGPNGFVKTGPLRSPDGKSIPKGRYKVFVYSAADQNPEVAKKLDPLRPSGLKVEEWEGVPPKLVRMKILFLGGPEDANYKARLESFHKSVREISLKELSEIDQFAKTLKGQADSTLSGYSKTIQGIRRPNALKDWNVFHGKWVSFDQHLATQFKKWTPEMIQSELFHGKLYAELIRLEANLSSLHQQQHALLNLRSPASAQQKLDLNKAADTINSSILSFNQKIEGLIRELQGMAVGAGLPKRE